MPIRICPRCGSNQNYWNILEANCKQCGYSIFNMVDFPSEYQMNKIDKHKYGSLSGSQQNWICDVDEKEIIKEVAAFGSTAVDWGIVASFSDVIGHKQTDSTKTTKWAAIVLYDSPGSSHIFPVDPKTFEGDQWECVNCGHIHIDECPILCKNCGKHMWLKEK
jgi:ribosomal protein L37E